SDPPRDHHPALPAPSTWTLYVSVPRADGSGVPFALAHHDNQSGSASEPVPDLPGATPPRQSGDEPAVSESTDKPNAAADELPVPQRAGLLSAGPAFVLSTLESATAALSEREPGHDGLSLPRWLGLCGWAAGVARAWLAIRPRRNQTEVALTQE